MGVHKPANVTVVAVSGSSIIIEWENMDEYDNIDLKRNVNGGDYVYRMDFDGGVESFLDAECEKEKTYCYILQGIIFTEEDEEVSGWTDPVCAMTLADLAAPSELVVNPISDTKVDLTFKVNSLIEDSVRIERKPDGGNYKEIAILSPRRDFFRDQGQTLTLLGDGYAECVASDIGKQVKDDTVEVGVLLAYDNPNRIWSVYSTAIIADASAITITDGTGAGTADGASAPLIKDQKYYWQVRVRKDDPEEDSAYCDAAYATTINNPGIPTLAVILATDTEDKSIRIRWSDVANETGYRIEMSIGDDSFGADEADLIAVVGAGVTDFLITGLTPGESYWFRVRAYNAAGYSDYSDVRTATTDVAYVPTEFEKWIRNPGIEPVYLAEIYTKMTLTGFTLESGVVWKKTIGASDRGIDILEVFEEGTAYDSTPTEIAEVQGTEASFWFDYDNRILYIHTTGGANPNTFDLIEGAFWLYFSTHKDIEFDNVNERTNHFLPLLSKGDIPDITQEIKPYFEGNFGMSSGSIAFANAKIGGEHFFDKRFEGYIWMNAKTILKAGKDTFAYADFKEIFTALIDSKSINDKKITFQLRDIREDMANNIILNKFDVTNYPDVEEKFRDKPIPVYFGTQNLITPIRVDEINERFKCNDGRIKSIDAVYRNGAKLEENAHYYIDLQRARITFDREGAFIITAGANDKIDFKESGGAELHATLNPDTYTTTGLCAEIKRAMEAVSGYGRTYTVTVDADTKKFTIGIGSFSILWKTGINGSDGTDTHVGTTIGFADGEDCEGKTSYEADEDIISIRDEDIIGIQLRGIVNSADEVISNGAEIFKYLMNTYKGLGDSELNLDSIYEAKYANERKLAVPIESEISFDEIVRTTEHSLEAYTFQDEFGRLGIRPQQTTVASKAKYIISDHMFGHSQKKDKSSLFWKVNIYYNKNLQSDVWEIKTATDNTMDWKYKVTKELPIHTYFRDAVNAQALATSILNLLNKEQVGVDLPMLLFDVMAGDLAVFSRTRFYNSAGTVDEITLRINRISKSPASGRTSITAEVVS